MLTQKTQRLVDRALSAVQDEQWAIYATGGELTSSQASKDLCKLRLAGLERECFDIVLLDNQHKVIWSERLFWGTVNAAAIYPREIIKTVLKWNAAACIVTHNHPSGTCQPSEADKQITQKIKTALDTIDVRLLDHIIVGNGTFSFSEHALL